MQHLIGAIGDLTVDVLLHGLCAIPDWGEEAEILGTRNRLGGNVGNMAVGARALCTDFEIVADIGDDENGDFVLSQIKKLGLGNKWIRVLNGAETSKTFACIREDGERFMLTSKGTLADIDQTLMRADIPDCKVLFFGGWCLPPRVEVDEALPRFRQWHEQGKILVTDLIWSEETWQSKDKLVLFLKEIDVVLMNEKELFELTSCDDRETAFSQIRELLKFADRENAIAVVKLGAEGAVMLNNDGLIYARPYPCVPVDTVGAGDLFNLGWLHAMYQLELPKQEAIDFASTFASLFISKYDSLPPNEEEVLIAMGKNK